MEALEHSALPLMREQQWFSDGIDEYETAILTAMRSLLFIREEYRKALIETRRIESKSVTLPLSRVSDLIVITHKQPVNSPHDSK